MVRVGTYCIDPLTDPRWETFVVDHASGGVFHSREWLRALQMTYAYKPVAFSISAPGKPLTSAVVFCEVDSWLTGRRLISLPFSDHCAPLVNSLEEYQAILAYACDYAKERGFTYVDVRPPGHLSPGWVTPFAPAPFQTFLLHTLSLHPPVEALFLELHRNCIQRKILRAERERLVYERGCSEALLKSFYRLLLDTRRRHGLPPQPLRWFRNLISVMADKLTIRVASKDTRPVASIMTLAFRGTVTYKFGCSDADSHRFGGMPFLFWKTIQEAKEQGMGQLDLGRSDLENLGLVTFKDRLGASRTRLQYYRLAPGRDRTFPHSSRRTRILKRVMCHLPDTALAILGRLLYRHVG